MLQPGVALVVTQDGRGDRPDLTEQRMRNPQYAQAVDEILTGAGRARAGKPEALPVFGEPARAITRNAIVIGVGFLPLLAAPLVPYKTVGFFLATIMAVSGLGTLLILPAMATLLQKWLFRKEMKAKEK